MGSTGFSAVRVDPSGLFSRSPYPKQQIKEIFSGLYLDAARLAAAHFTVSGSSRLFVARIGVGDKASHYHHTARVIFDDNT